MNKFFAALIEFIFGPPRKSRPEPLKVDSEKIIILVSIKESHDYLAKEFIGSSEGEWKYWSYFNNWHPHFTCATYKYEDWKRDLIKSGFIRINNKDYPVSDIKDIELTKKENWITIK